MFPKPSSVFRRADSSSSTWNIFRARHAGSARVGTGTGRTTPEASWFSHGPERPTGKAGCPRLAAAAVIALVLIPASGIQAAPYTWDGGTGTWDAVSTNWSGLAWGNTSADEAIFDNMPGTVTIDTGSGVTANRLTFQLDGFVINGNIAADVLALAGTNPAIHVSNAPDTATVDAVISGTAGLVKTGPGTLLLNGANNHTGITRLTDGVLVVGNIDAMSEAFATGAGGKTLRLATDTPVAPFTVGTSSGHSLTILSDRTSPGAGITHALGAASLGGGSSTVTLAAGSNVTSGTGGVTFASLVLSAGTATANTTLAPTTATAAIAGNVTRTGTSGIKTLGLAGSIAGNSISGTINNNGGGLIAITKSGASTWTLGATNSDYTGITTITAGVLEVAGLANGGTSSSIGASTNAAANLVFGAAGATLRYIGSADATTDRGFTTSSGSGGGATIQSSGTGTLSIGNTVPIALGTVDQTRTITLGGTNTGANTFSKIIANNGIAATSLTKTGTGTWVINGPNTFTGNTTINGGTLVAAHPGAFSASGAIAISTTSGGGSLQLATDTTVDPFVITSSSLNPGTIISDRATPGPGIVHVLGNCSFGRNTYTFQAGPNVTSGIAGITIGDAGLGAGSPGGTTVLNPTTATLTIQGGVSSTVNSHPKNLELGGTSAGNTINGSVSNGNNVVSVTKSNTSTWTLAGANTYSGNTTVSGGTLTLAQINPSNETSTVTIAPGAILDLAYSGTDAVDKLFIGPAQQAPGIYGHSNSGATNGGLGVGALDAYFGPGAGTLTVATGPAGFSSWITGTFANGTVPGGQQGENDDPDNDGISNLIEYAIAGLDPTASDTAVGSFTGLTLAFTKRSPLAPDLVYIIETSANLQPPWTAQVTHGPGNTNPTISFTLPSGGGKLFARLKVEK